MSSIPDRPLARTRITSTNLRQAWHTHAAEFIAWARKPHHDSYWRFHRAQFLPLIPPPGRRTLDLGCGEGRLSRDLTSLGHRVVSLDASSTMVNAVKAETPAAALTLATAEALPFADASFDAIVAFMSLQDIDDLQATVREASRVLEPGGRLALAIVHPLNSAGRFAGDSPDSPFRIEGSYLDPSWYSDNLTRDGLTMTFVSVHRPISMYVETLADAGFLLERLREPAMPHEAITVPRLGRWRRLPLFLHMRAVKRA